MAVAGNSSGNNKAAYSEDGIIWKSTMLPSSAYWFDVTYGSGKFVAIARSSSNAAYSEDGITWKTTTLPVSAVWYGTAYGNGKFVAVAYGSDTAAYSTAKGPPV